MANVVNPYSFVPLGTAPARTSLDACYTGPLLTGRLDYTLTTDTPLLIPDSAKVVKDEKIDHKRYPFSACRTAHRLSRAVRCAVPCVACTRL